MTKETTWHISGCGLTKAFYENWLEDNSTAIKVSVFCFLSIATTSAGTPTSRMLRPRMNEPCRGHNYCDFPTWWLVALPRDECETIWSFPVHTQQPDRLFHEGNSGRGKATSDQVWQVI